MTRKERESGIELIKIISVFLIIVSHVTITLTEKSNFELLNINSGYIQFNTTPSLSEFILMIFRYFGSLGNLIFIISSSYFLVDSKKNNSNKIIKLWVNVITISLIFLVSYLLIGVDINKELIIKSIFPIVFKNNWFITIYLLFLMVIPYLNIIIEKLSQKELFRLSLVLFILYFCISFIKASFDLNEIIIFITIYFTVSYLKKYMEEFLNKKRCIILFFLGIISLFLLQLLTNYSALRFTYVQNHLMHWVVDNNPILLMIAISLFYLFKRLKFKNKTINSISLMSLYVYLIHENILFRTITRVHIWFYIYNKIGYKYIVIDVLLYSVILYIVSSLLSYLYKILIESFLNNNIDKIISYKNKIKMLKKWRHKVTL